VLFEEDLIDQHLCSCEERLARALLLIALRQDTQANRGHPENQSWNTRGIDWLNPQPGLLFYE